MKTRRPLQFITVAFALSMLTAYVVYSQRQQTRTVAPSSKVRVLDEFKQRHALLEMSNAASQKPFMVAPGSKGGLVRLDETIPRETGATNNHTENRNAGFVASSSKSISPLIRVQPEGIGWVSITSAPVALRGTSVQRSLRPAPSGRSAKVFPGSKSATVFTPAELHSFLGSTNLPKPASAPATKTNILASPKSQP